MKNAFALSAMARLMASENLAVIHSPNVHTASMDLERRHLILPIWNNISPALYDLLLSHEIAHAKYTPLAGWHGAICEHGRAFKGYLNVIEDVRIEKLIKRDYPGLVRSFTTAYRELLDRDFFGLEKRKVKPNSLNIIDRINLHAKVGAYLPIDFSKEEKAILDEVMNLETFEEVKVMAARLFKIDKDSEEAAKNSSDNFLRELFARRRKIEEQMRVLREQGADENYGDSYEEEEEEEEEKNDKLFSTMGYQSNRLEFEEAPSKLDWRSDEEKATDAHPGDEAPEKVRGKKASKEMEELIEENRFKETSSTDDLRNLQDELEEVNEAIKETTDQELNSTRGSSGGTPSGDPIAQTDEDFRANEDSLMADAETRRHMYGNDEKIMVVPEVDLSKFIVPAENVISATERYFEAQKLGGFDDGLDAFLRKEQSVINQLVAEFEMRKNAAQFARAGSAKTGSINMKRLHTIGLSEDIFQRIMKVPEGKSHGMVMYFDQSYSMGSIYARTINQMIILLEFCRRMSIPFDVYGFSDDGNGFSALRGGESSTAYPAVPTAGKVMMRNKSGFLKQYIHSGMSTVDYKRALLNLWRIRMHSNRGPHERLNGTPLNQTILLSGQMVKKFQLAAKVDIVNVLFLTDGEAGDISDCNSSYNSAGAARLLWNGHMSAKFKMDRYNCATNTAAAAQLMAKATGANYIGIFIPSDTRSQNQAIRKYHNVQFFDKLKPAKFKPEKDGFLMSENFGFNSFFIIKPLSNNLDVSLNEVTKEKTATQMTKVFSKAVSGRVQNRAFLAVFATQIANKIE